MHITQQKIIYQTNDVYCFYCDNDTFYIQLDDLYINHICIKCNKKIYRNNNTIMYSLIY